MAELKPTEQEIVKIANEYCRLQMGIKSCGECIGYQHGCCGWLREKIIPLTAVAFAIDAWNRRK